ncbi:MAG: GntR family transcriptional regulator [Candidatus Omnitrophica bacterium]|nr:GntR family transcriptional regulator [Candidatus Omnitrophota bacterium]MCM8801818.1 GntR family transcriptional regulator [Candidatus Omnitrophota bacterium]
MTSKTRKLSKEEKPLPYYYQLKEILKEQIKKGKLKIDSPIPSEFQLMEEYGVSRITVVKAINELVSEGFLYRIQGKGTFVKSKSGKIKEEEIVGLIMQTEGHLWGTLTKKIIQGLNGRYLCIPIDFKYKENLKEELKNIHYFIEKNPAYLIIYGISVFPFELLSNYKGKIIFTISYEWKKEIENASYILHDYYYGGKIAVEYLLSKGFKKIVFLTYPVSPDQIEQAKIIKGGIDALKEKNLPEENFIIFTEEDRKKIKELLKKEKKPIGIFSEGDFRAKIIYDISKEMGLKIPDDISIIGYYNTPWCEILSPKLTSIYIKEEKIAELVVGKILNPESLPDKIIIKPEIIERESVKK